MLLGAIAPYLAIAAAYALTFSAPWLRRKVTPAVRQQVQRELRYNEALQRFRGPIITRLVRLSASSVCIEFYVLLLPPIGWAGYHEVLWCVVLTLAAVMYLGDYCKVSDR
jgi:hypothetical protein